MAKFLLCHFADKLTGAAAVDGEPKNVIIDDREYQRDRRLGFTANCKILVKLRRDLRRNSTTPQKVVLPPRNRKYKHSTADRKAVGDNSLFG